MDKPPLKKVDPVYMAVPSRAKASQEFFREGSGHFSAIPDVPRNDAQGIPPPE
jgi:hypothetical protein